MSFCTKCGTEVPENANFCQKCGNALHTVANTDTSVLEEGIVKNKFIDLRDNNMNDNYIGKDIAEQGNAEAQFNLWVSYANGYGVPKDMEKAVYWLTKAAEQGLAPAQHNLAIIYENGLGIQKDLEKSHYWYIKAAEQGLAEAQANVGLDYALGYGVPIDNEKANYWYAKAAEHGMVDSQYNLGLNYVKGNGIPKDMDKAIYWFTKAAEQGHVWAQECLGSVYAHGEGVPKDIDKAIYWYTKAAELSTNKKGNGDSNALQSWLKNQKYDELFEQFKSVFEKEGENAAFSYLDDCIAKNPNCAEAYLIRGEVYSQIDFQQAIDDFEKAIGIDPNMSQSYFVRGLLYANSGDNNKAFADFSKAIELDESNFKAYTNRANMYLKFGEFQRVVSDCTKAIELMSGDGEKSFEPYYNRGLAYANMGEVEKALDDYIKVIELAPENAEAYAKCGLLYSELGRVQEAIRSYEKFLELDTNNTKAELVRNALRDLRNGNATPTNSTTSSGGCYVSDTEYSRIGEFLNEKSKSDGLGGCLATLASILFLTFTANWGGKIGIILGIIIFIHCLATGSPSGNGIMAIFFLGIIGAVIGAIINFIKQRYPEKKFGNALQSWQNPSQSSNAVENADTEDLSLFDYYVKCFKNYANFKGKARRKEFWGFSLFNTIFGLVLYFTLGHTTLGLILSPIYTYATFLPGLAVTFRRFHDIGKSGWNCLWCLTIIGIIPVLIWLCEKGESGTNQ